MIRAVIDTNVVFEGLTNRSGISGLIIDAWLGGLFQPCVCQALVYEYLDVFQRLLSERRWVEIRPVLTALLTQTEVSDVYFSWRPSSPDPGDEHVIDCVMNANAVLVTLNRRDFRLAQGTLGLVVLSPTEFYARLTSSSRTKVRTSLASESDV